MKILKTNHYYKLKKYYLLRKATRWLFYYGGNMNRVECKKYIRKALKKISAKNISISEENLERCIKEVINDESRLYIAYGKMALHILKNSATEIAAKTLIGELDVIPRLYSDYEIINITERM